MCAFFFFFKQKTAYEMRISDWSSDVCSSDLHPSFYGNLLKERIAKGGVDCWLVNTGWTGGQYGAGSRMPIKVTRALPNAALDGSLNGAEFRTDPNFGFKVPVAVAGVDSKILDPRETWADKAAYDATAQQLRS